MGFKMKGPSMNISYGGESNKQQKSNLLKDNPVAKHASAMNMNGSPFHVDPPQTEAESKKAAEKEKNKSKKLVSGKLPSYDEAYDAQSDKKKKSQSREQFKKEAKDYNTKKYGTTEPTKDSEKQKITRDKLAENKTKADKNKTKKVVKETVVEKKAPKSKKEVRQENRANRKAGRKERRSARLDKKIEKQTNKGKAAGDGGEKGIDSKALKKSKRVTNLKKRKAKADKGTEREVKSDSPAAKKGSPAYMSDKGSALLEDTRNSGDKDTRTAEEKEAARKKNRISKARHKRIHGNKPGFKN